MNAVTPAVALHRIALADCLPQPWKNAGGHTRELLAWPTTGPWALRISVATIERDGPFSVFEGIERWFAVIDGPGVQLQWPTPPGAAAGRSRVCRTGDAPIVFDGADPPVATVQGAPSTDFNLMVRRSAGRAMLVTVQPGLPCPVTHRWRGVFVNRDAWLRGPAAAPVRLEAGTLAYAALPAAPAWVLDPVEREGMAAGPNAAGPLGWWIGFEASSPPLAGA